MFDELLERVNRLTGDVALHVRGVRGERKLVRMRNVMEAFGNPQNKIRVVHVAGTSGKTSTTYYAAAFLRAYGYVVGMTVSPNVVDVRDRAQIGGGIFGDEVKPLAKDEYARYLAEFLGLVEEYGVKPSYMEFYMGFFYWLMAKTGVDFAVVETGLGGLYDSSNVVTRADKICVITDIGFDHTEILGRTLPEIAAQKAGIIQAGNAVFMHEQAAEIMAVVRARCEEAGASLTVVPNEKNAYFQQRNMGLARAAVSDVVRDARELQIAAHVPARAEEFVWQGKSITVDGAHNPQKLRAFVDFAKKRCARPVLVVSFGENKVGSLKEDFAILRELSSAVILVEFHDKSVKKYFRNSISFGTMREAALGAGFERVEAGGEAKTALELACLRAEESGTKDIVVVGSFFLACDARRFLLGEVGGSGVGV